MPGVLLENAIVAGPGGTAGPSPRGEKTFHAYLRGVAAVTASISIQVSDVDPSLYASSWITAAIFTMSGSIVVSEGFTLPAGHWSYWRANLLSINGTSAVASVWVNQ